jgi:hypothetical protein
MYFEKSHSFVNRHGWTFTHTGEQLQPLAQQLHDLHKRREQEARDCAAELLRDARIHHEDKRVIQAKNDIVKHGKLREKCAVWVYEFGRTPTREFSLGIGDVYFFGLFPVVETPVPPHGASKRDDWKYTYKASELFRPFRAKCEALRAERKGVLKALKRTVAPDTEEEQEFHQEVTENTLLAEEFEKNPDKDVILALGDIVYLGLAPLLDLSGEQTE